MERQKHSRRIQAGVTLHLMAKIRLGKDGSPTRLYIQEAVAIFQDTGRRHRPDAEKTLNALAEHLRRPG